MANQINFKVGYTVDKSGLNDIKTALQSIQNLTSNDLMSLNKGMDLESAKAQLTQIKQTTKQVQDALTRSFNTNLGTLNISKFSSELKSLDINRVYHDFASAGEVGKSTFRNITSEILTTNMQLKQTHNFLDNIATTMSNTIKWGVASSIMNELSGSIQKAYFYTKDLDRSLNDIRIVTGKSSEDMANFAKEANNAAKTLSASTLDYTDASLIYYQQGLTDEEVKARTEVTLKAANVTQQDTAEVSEQLTAVWNGYKVSAQEAELYVDKLAAVAASTASDLEELSVGMSKVASAASSMGVDVDQLNAQLSTIISVTRQAPESVGTALKTIYARMGDLELNGEDEFGVSLGEVSESLSSVGIQILDTKGNLREMGDVIEEVGNKWNTDAWSQAEKQALAIDLAGKRQYNNLIALFENWDKYTEAINTSKEAVGTLQQQQDIYSEGTQAHLQKMRTAFEDLHDSILDTDTINNFADGAALAAELMSNLIDSIGGGGNALLGLGSIATMVFSKQIAQGLNTTIANFQNAKSNAEQLSAQLQILQDFKGIDELDASTQELVDMKQKVIDLGNIVTEEQYNISNSFIQQRKELQDTSKEWEDAKKSAEEYYERMTGDSISITGLKKDSKEEKAYQEELDIIAREFENVEKDARDFQEALTKATEAEMLFSDTEAEDSLKELYLSLDNVNSLMDGYVINVEEIIKRDKASIETKQELVTALRDYKTAMANSTEGKESLVNDIEVQESANNLVNAYKKAGQEMRQQAKQTSSTIAIEVTERTNQIKNSLAENEKQYNKFIGDIERQSMIQNFVKITGAIGQMTFAAQSFMNLGNIWSDENLSDGEKFLQTVTNLSMIIPSAVAAFSTFKSSITGLAVTLGFASAETVTLSGAIKALWVAMGPIGWVIAGISALGVAIGSIVGITKHLAKANDEFNQSMMETGKVVAEENKNIASLKASYDTLLKQYKETGEGKDQLIDITNQLDEALGIEGSALDKLSDNWDNYTDSILRAQKTKAESSIADLESAKRSAGEEFSDSMREGTGNVSPFSGKYKADFGIATKEQAEIFNEALKDMDSSYSVAMEGMDTFYQSIELNGSSAEELYEVYKRIEQAMKRLSEEGYSNSDLYKSLSSWYDKAKESAIAYEEAQNNLIENQTTLAVINAQLENNLKTPTNLEEFKEYRNQFVQLLKDAQEAKKLDSSVDIYKIADEYMAKFQSELDVYREQFNAIEELRNRLKGDNIDSFINNLSDEDLEILASISIDDGATVEEVKRAMSVAKAKATEETSYMGIEAIGAAIDSLSEKGTLEKLDEEQKKYFDDILQTAEGINGLSKASEEWSYISNTGIQEQIEWLTHLQAQESNNYVEQVSNRKALMEEELKLKETQKERLLEHLELAQEEQKQFQNKYSDDELQNNNDYQKLLEQISKIKQELYDTSEAAGNLEEIINNTNWQFDLDMAGVDEILTVGDSLLSESEKIKEAAMLIGEGFIVAAEDAQQLADIYPALYENAQILADGQVQLSADTVQTLLGDEQVLLDGDVQANVARIDGQIALLEAKKAAAEAELQLAQAVAQGEVDLTKEQIDIISNGRQSLTDYLMQLGVEEANANKAAAAAMAGNMDEYNRITAGIADDTANNLANAMAAAATATRNNASNMVSSIDAIQKQAVLASNAIRNMPNGTATDNGQVSVGGGSAGGSGFSATSRTGNFKGLNATQSTASKPNISGWINDLQLDISGYTQGIAQLNALKAQLLASQKDTSQALQNASSGLGGTPSKGSGSGGGGGSSDKEKEPEIIEQIEDEADSYHDVDLRIKEITKDLDRLQDKQKKLTGKDLINNLNQQLKLLEKQKEAYNDKLEIAKMEADAVKSILKAQGVTFDTDGSIANYFTAMQTKMNYVNDVIAKYNNMSATEQEAYKDTVEKAKEDYENFKSLIDEYDNLISDKIPGLEDDIQDALDKQIEIQIKEFTMEVDLRLNMADAERDFNEFKKKVIDGIKEDDILGNALSKLTDFSSYYKSDGTGVIETLTKQVNETIDQINQINGGGFSSVYGDDKSKAMEDLQNYYKELMNQLENVEDLVDEIKESYLDMIDEAKDKFDEQIDQYEYITDLIDHNINLIGLLYGDNAYGQLEKYYKVQEENNNKQLDFYKQQVDFWKQRMDAEEEGSEAWEKYKKNWQDAVLGLNQTVESSVQNLIDKYTNSINKIFNELNNKLTNGQGLDYIGQEWNLINKNADQYLDKVNSMYEIQKLENKYLDAIDKTDSLAGQEKLNSLMGEQLKMLKDKEKLTQYDVDRANALYDIALKEIALQDAQQNKSKMRLRRDSQGNYSYQYVSDEDSIAQAQQELADAQNSLYNMDKDKYKNNLDEIYNIYSEFQQQLLELYADQTLSEEEREKKKKMLVEQYGELINGLVEQNEDIRKNLQDSTFQELANLYNQDVNNFLQMSEEERDILMNSMIPQWSSGIQQMTDVFAGEGGFISSCEEAFKELEQATKDYQDSLDNLQSSADIDFDSIANGYDKNIQLTEDLISSNEELINKYNEQINAIQDVMTQVTQLIAKYEQAKNAAIAATQAAYGYWQQENANAAKENGEKNPNTGGSGNGSSSGGGSSNSGSNGGSSNTKEDGVPKVGEVVTFTGGTYYYDSNGTAPSGNRGPGKKVTITYVNEKAPYPIHVESSDSAYGWLKKSQISGFESGGYTGDWSSKSGKLAILHEKEIVLNKKDTENLLSSVNIVRDIDSLSRSLNSSVVNRIANLLSNFSSVAKVEKIDSQKDDFAVDQNVQIDATFTDARSANEIKEALNNLINTASQYAYSTKK